MIALLFALLVALELFRRLPVVARFRDLAAWGQRSLGLVQRRRVSEWAKERAMRLMSLRLFQASARAGLMLVAVAAPIAIVLAVDSGLDLGAHEALFDWQARLIILLICAAYAVARWQYGRLRAR